MHKRLMIVIMATVVVLAFGGTAFAALGSLPASGDSFKYSLSNDVTCNYDKDANSVHYVMNCKNSAGNRVFSASDATSKLFYMEDDAAYPGVDIGSLGQTVAGAEDDDFGAGWTAL